MIRKLLNSKKGEGYLDVVVGVVALAMFIVVALNIFTFVSLKTTMDRIADDLIEVATYSGAFGEDFDLKVDQLKAKYFDFDVEVYTEEYFNTEHKRVQMGEDMGITIKVNSSVAGIDIALPIDLTVSRVGQSEQYWRVASGVYEEPEIDYTGKTLFVLNTSTGKFHYPHCSLVPSIKEKNKKEVYSTAEELTALGYSPCGTCDAHDCSTNVVTHFNVYGHWGYCEICGRQDEIEKHWWTYDEKLDQYYCEYCEAIENKDGNYACSNGSLLTEEAHPMGCGCNLTPPTLTVNGLSTDSANPTILEQAGTVRIAGIAKDREGAVLAVTVNGAKAKLFADGEWYYDLDFNNTTSNTITVVAIDEDGMETTVNCYAELPVILVTITTDNKYEIMDAIGVDYTLTGYPLTIPEYYFVGDTKYKIIGIGYNAFREEYSLGPVVIEGANRDYFTIAECAFQQSGITSLKFEGSIRSIGDMAFAGCDSLSVIDLPVCVEYLVGTEQFMGCDNLYVVNIQAGRTVIESGMFDSCYNLYTINGFENITEIYAYAFTNGGCGIEKLDLSNINHLGQHAFYDCGDLIEVKIPNLSTWEEEAFRLCENLEKVTIAPGNAYIPEGTFRDCISLESVSCPNNTIQEIGSYAFYNCGEYLPSTWTFQSPLTTIGDYAFYGCPSITEFVFNEEIEYIGENAFHVGNEVETTLSGTITGTVLQYDWAGSNRIIGSFPGIYYEDGDYVSWEKAVELGYISVSDSGIVGSDCTIMFDNGNKPGRIMIPDEYTYVNANAFSSCAGLTGFTMSKNSSMNMIGEGAFAYCDDLQNVVLSNNLRYIEAGAFASCSNLDSVTLSQNLQSIGDYSFSECNLSKIVIPSSATYIGSNAFSYNENLDEITFYGTPTTIGTDVFLVSNNLETHVYGNLSDIVHDYDWEGSNRYTGATVVITSGNRVDAGYYDGVTSLTIRDVYIDSGTGQVVRPVAIGSSAFASETSLTTIDMPSSITSIYSSAFSQCTKLQTIAGLENVETIGASAFYNCNQLSGTLSLLSVTRINTHAFAYCTNLLHVSMPSILDVYNYAFQGCTNLYTVSFGSSLKTIEGYAFAGCTNLSSPTLPASLTTIGLYAFSNCTNIEAVTIPSSVTSVGAYAFYGCTKLHSLYWQAPCDIPNRCFMNATIGELMIVKATGIGPYAFANAIKNYGSISVSIPNSVIYIEASAFASCTGIRSLYLGYSVSFIGDRAFQGCTGMTTFTISSGSELTSVGQAAWMNTGLTSMTTLGNAPKLTAIPVQAFASCSALQSVTIPYNIKTIGANAFASCTKLTSVTIVNSSGTGTSTGTLTMSWYVSTSASATSGTTIYNTQLSNASTAANLLRNTYKSYYWFRK